MTYEEYAKIVKGMVENPDSVPVEADNLLNAIKEDTSVITSLATEKKELEEKNDELRKANIELYGKYVLSQSEGDVEDEPDEKTPDEVLDELFGDLI